MTPTIRLCPAVISRGAAAFVVLTGCLVLIGWLLDVPTLKSLHPSLVSMKANAAILLIFSGASCWLAGPTETNLPVRRVRDSAAAFVILVAGLTLVEWLFGFDLGIDQLLFRDTPDTIGTLYPGRIVPWTAVAFLMFSTAVLLLDARSKWARDLSSCLALSAGLIGLLSLTGYAYHAELLYGLGLHFHIAVPTCVGFLFLTVAILFARPDQSVMAFVLGETPGGRMVRRLLPSFALILFTFGWLEQVGLKARWFDASLGIALVVLASALVSAGLITWNALALNQADAQRRRADEDLQAANATLEARVAERTAAAGARAHELLRLIGDLQKQVVERQRSEEQVRRANAYNRSLLEASLDPLVTIGPDGKITDVNAATEAATGYSREELVGRDFAEHFTEPERARAGYQQVFSEGAVRDYPLELRHRDGQVRSVLYNAAVYRDDSGNVVGVFAAARDITERKRAEEALRASEERTRMILDTANDPFITINARGEILDWNRQAELIFGWSREEAMGRILSETIIPPQHREAHDRGLRDFLVTGNGPVFNAQIELTSQRRDGSEFPVELLAWPVRTGGVLTISAFVRDITERKRAEGEIRLLAHLQSVVAELGQQALRSQGYASVLDTAVILVAQALGVEYCNVSELLPGGEEFMLRAGIGWKEGDVGRATFKSSDSQAGYTLRSEHPVIVEDAPTETRFVPLPMLLGEPIVSSMSVVISTRKGPYGALGAHSKRRRTFTNDEIHFLQAIANVLGAVIERNQAEAQVERLARLQAVVAGLGQRALAEEPLGTLFDETVSLVARTLEVEYCKVLELLPDGAALLLRAGVGWRAGLVGQATVGSGADSQAGYTLLSDQPVIVEDLRTETRFSGPPLLHEHGVVSGMSVIISTSEGPYGVLGAHTKSRRVFTRDEVHFLQAIANVLGTATQRRRAEEALRRINRAHRALSSCNEALIRATDESALLQQICQIIVDEASYRFCWVGYAEQDDARMVRPVAQAGFEEGYLKTVQVTWADTERGRGPTGTCIRTGQTVVIKNTAIDPGFVPWRDEALQRGYASVIAIPLLVDATPLGALGIYASEPAAFVEGEVKLLTELANDLAYGVQTLRTRAERASAAAALRERDEHVGLLLNSTAEAICGIDLEGRCDWVNQACARMLGYAGPADFLGKNLHALVHHSRADGTPLPEEECQVHQHLRRGDDVHVDDQVLWRADGTCFPVEYWSHPVHRDGQLIGAVVTFLDITARKKAESQIQHLAYFDALTELPNRVLFQDRLKQSLAHATRQNRLVAVHFFDLDHFKDINDSLGHAVGDTLLKAVGERLQRSVRASDTVARLGGDEFAILQTDLVRVEGAATLAAKLLKVMSEPFPIDDRQIRTTASIGITVYPLDDSRGSQLLQNADMAMYLAKKEGRNNYQFYTASLNTELQEHITLLADLHHALERREFVLHYQPQVDLRHGGTIGMEALIRWQHPVRGLLPPGKFVALAEETGLIVSLGRWVLEQACAQNRAWQAAGLPARRVAINISAMQFKHDDLVAAISETLEKTSLAPQWLELELTESTLLQDLQAGARTIQQLHKRGIQVAIDDFGTGYSSLSYLSRLPVDKLKIDQSFVRSLPGDPDAAAVAKTIIDLGHCLKMKVIAEGVETKAQLDYLLEKGCDEGQGYYFNHPLPAADLASVLEKEKG